MIEYLPLTNCMRKALDLPDLIIYIEPHDKYPFSAYVVNVEGQKNYCLRLWLDIIEHLIDCDHCRKDLGLSKADLEAERKSLDGWIEVTYPLASRHEKRLFSDQK